MTTPESVKRERNDSASHFASSLWDGDFACSLPRTPEGRRRVIVASYEDEMSDVYERVHAGERPVTLCVEVGTWGVIYPTWSDADELSGDSDADIHELAPHSKLGLFLSYLMERDVPVRFRLKYPETVAMRTGEKETDPRFALTLV